MKMEQLAPDASSLNQLQLTRKLGLGHIFAIIVGSVIGSGVFITLPIVAKLAGSPGLAILAWGLGGLVWIPQVLILAELVTAFPQEGFGYTYLKAAGSRGLAFLYVWTVFWTSDTPSVTIIALSATSAVTVFFPWLAGAITGKIFAAVLIALLALIHYRDVKAGGNLQILLTLAKITPLILLVVMGCIVLNRGDIFWKPSPTPPPTGYFTLLVTGVAATTWSYAGFPNALYVAGEIKNPRQNLPVALITATIGITILYILIALATSAIVPYHELLTFESKFVNPFQYLPSMANIAAGFLAVAAFISMVGAMNACIMIQPRLQYAVARDGIFWRAFAHVHPRYQTPDYSIILQATLAMVLLFFGNIEHLLGYFTFSYLIQNALLYATLFIFRKKVTYQPKFRAPAWRVLVILALIIQLYLAYGTIQAYPLAGILATLTLIATGLPIYWYFQRQLPKADG